MEVKERIIYLDGKLVAEKEAKISVFDHGLLYGDGIFEGIRVYDGRIFRLQEHLERLFHSGQMIRLRLPWSEADLTRALEETIRANGLRDAYIRLVVTRGVGDLGLDPDRCPRPSLIIIVTRIRIYPQEFYEKGMKIITSSVQRISEAALSPQAKTLNYLNNVLAKLDAKNAGVEEALMLNSWGYVAECTADNLFIYRQGSLQTPPPSSGALTGITRKVVLELAQELGIPVEFPLMTKYDLYTAEECFLTGTAAEVVPVVNLDGRSIGEGEVGPITRRLMEAFHEKTRKEGFPVEGF